jgi:hypothetical protein
VASNPAKNPGHVLSPLLPNEAVTLDATAFDNLVHNQGVRFVHYRAMKCPVGLTSPDDIRRTHADHSGCSNGFVYVAKGRVTSLFLGNHTELRKFDAGIADGSSVVVTFPRFYDETESRILVRPYDRFYLEEEGVTTGTWDVMKRRADGHNDRPRFPAVRVHEILDSNGRWWDSTAFDIVDGDIRWKDLKGPPPGTVYTAWYEYKPYWLVDKLVHEIRVIPVADYMDANKVGMERLSFGAVLVREYVHRDQAVDDQAPQSTRQQLPPEEDEFGSR